MLRNRSEYGSSDGAGEWKSCEGGAREEDIAGPEGEIETLGQSAIRRA